MMILKNIQREKTKIVDIVQKQCKTIRFEFEFKKLEINSTEMDTRNLPVTIYFDYIKSRNVKVMSKINIGNFYEPTLIDRDSKVFWGKIYKDIEKEIRLGFCLIPVQNRTEIIDKIYFVIKQVAEVEEEILVVSV